MMLYRVTARSRDGCFLIATGIWTVRARTPAEAISMARLIATRAVWPAGSFWSVDQLTRQLDWGAESKSVRQFPDGNGVGDRVGDSFNAQPASLDRNRPKYVQPAPTAGR